MSFVSTHIIEITGIKLYAFHGCLPEEGKIGGHYIVDVMLNTDFSSATSSDTLSDTIDYVEVNLIVKEEMAIRSKLIEHVGQRIVERLKNRFSTLQSVRVKIRKLCPPIQGDVDEVSITIQG
jgi:dihydroneopterin aldolase